MDSCCLEEKIYVRVGRLVRIYCEKSCSFASAVIKAVIHSATETRECLPGSVTKAGMVARE